MSSQSQKNTNIRPKKNMDAMQTTTPHAKTTKPDPSRGTIVDVLKPVSENGLLLILANELAYFKNICASFIDKIVLHSINDVNDTYKHIPVSSGDTPNRLVITGGKALQLYCNLHSNARFDNITSFDYDINYVGEKHDISLVLEKLNAFIHRNYKANKISHIMFKNIVDNFNRKSELIEIVVPENLDQTNVFTIPTDINQPMFGRIMASVYLLITYKFKSFVRMYKNKDQNIENGILKKDNINAHADVLYRYSVPDETKLNTLYYTGLSCVDLHNDTDFSYFFNISRGIELEENTTMLKVHMREQQDIYDRRIEIREFFLPTIEMILMSTFLMSSLKQYHKSERNRRKMDTVLSLIENPIENLNMTIFQQIKSGELYTNALKIVVPAIKRIFIDEIKKGVDSTLSCTESELYDVLNKIARFYDNIDNYDITKLLSDIKLATTHDAVPDNRLVNDVLLMYNKFDLNRTVYLNITFNEFMYRFIHNSSNINFPLLTKNIDAFVPKTDNFRHDVTVGDFFVGFSLMAKLMYEYAYFGMSRYDFFVYNVSQVYNKNPENSPYTYFKIGEIINNNFFRACSYSKKSKHHAGFIGSDLQPFIFRIQITPYRYSSRDVPFIFLPKSSQYEVVILPLTYLKVTGIKSTYIELNNLYLNCLLIDCILIPASEAHSKSLHGGKIKSELIKKLDTILGTFPVEKTLVESTDKKETLSSTAIDISSYKEKLKLLTPYSGDNLILPDLNNDQIVEIINSHKK